MLTAHPLCNGVSKKHGLFPRFARKHPWPPDRPSMGEMTGAPEDAIDELREPTPDRSGRSWGIRTPERQPDVYRRHNRLRTQDRDRNCTRRGWQVLRG